MVLPGCPAPLVPFKYNPANHWDGYDHTLDNTPDPIPNSEVKLQWARLVLGWGTTRESRGVVSVLIFLLVFWLA